jgi:riboflavin kinase/FMN adenylyltransferase
VESHQLLPRIGIYAGYLCTEDQRLPAAISAGYNVVFGGTEVKIEAFVLDFDGDLRGRQVRIEFVEYLREERNFDSVDALVQQIGNDVEATRRILSAAGV